MLRVPKDLPDPAPHGVLNLIKGTLWQKIKKLANEIANQNNPYRDVVTPNAISGVKGTEYVIRVQEDGTTVCYVFDGIVELSDINSTKTVLVNAGQTAMVRPQGAPSDPIAFDGSKLDKWWDRFPETEKTGGMSSLLFIIIPTLILVAGLLIILILRKRRKPKNTLFEK
jgi:hypothetical protein